MGARFPQAGVELTGCAGGFPLALHPAGVGPPLSSALISGKIEMPSFLIIDENKNGVNGNGVKKVGR